VGYAHEILDEMFILVDVGKRGNLKMTLLGENTGVGGTRTGHPLSSLLVLLMFYV
jgi:hypothetical protein